MRTLSRTLLTLALCLAPLALAACGDDTGDYDMTVVVVDSATPRDLKAAVDMAAGDGGDMSGTDGAGVD